MLSKSKEPIIKKVIGGYTIIIEKYSDKIDGWPMEVSMEMSGISSQDVRYRGICRVHGATIAIEKARHARNVLNLKQFTICIRVKGGVVEVSSVGYNEKTPLPTDSLYKVKRCIKEFFPVEELQRR